MNLIPILMRAVWFPANRINAVYAKCRLKCSDGILLYWKLPFSTIPSDKPCRIRFYAGRSEYFNLL